jgi:hypothetical protein
MPPVAVLGAEVPPVGAVVPPDDPVGAPAGPPPPPPALTPQPVPGWQATPSAHTGTPASAPGAPHAPQWYLPSAPQEQHIPSLVSAPVAGGALPVLVPPLPVVGPEPGSVMGAPPSAPALGVPLDDEPPPPVPPPVLVPPPLLGPTPHVEPAPQDAPSLHGDPSPTKPDEKWVTSAAIVVPLIMPPRAS